MKRVISQNIDDVNNIEDNPNDYLADFTDHRNRRLQSALSLSSEHLNAALEKISEFQDKNPTALYEDLLNDEEVSYNLRQAKYYLAGFFEDF